MKHTRISPSKLDRIINCPGSLLACEGLTERKSEFADEGTLAHDIAAKCLRENKTPRELTECPDDAAGFISEYLDALRLRKEFYPDLLEFIEERFDISAYVQGMSGTADYVGLCADTRTIFVDDLKYGAGVKVEAEGNAQMMAYALGVHYKYGNLIRATHVTMTVHQPRYRDEVKQSSWTIPVAQLIVWGANTLVPACKIAEMPGGPLNPGAWCRFCLAKQNNVCPELRQSALAAVDFMFDDESIPVTVQQETLPIIKKLTGEQLSRCFQAGEMFEIWWKQLQEEIESRLKGGEKIPGLKLVNSRKTRSWKDPIQTEIFFNTVLPADIPIMEPPKLLSVARMEKEFKTKKLNLDLTDFISITQGTTIALESDKRPAIETVNTMFDMES